MKIEHTAPTLTVLSQPAVHRRFTGAEGGCEPTMLPAGTAGAQDTAVTPMACALGICGDSRRTRAGQHDTTASQTSAKPWVRCLVCCRERRLRVEGRRKMAVSVPNLKRCNAEGQTPSKPKDSLHPHEGHLLL